MHVRFMCVCALNVDVRCLVLCCGLCWIDL
ncbi:hypothetical protein LINPERHAP1_LOCUS12798 [Linum perenne]